MIVPQIAGEAKTWWSQCYPAFNFSGIVMLSKVGSDFTKYASLRKAIYVLGLFV